MQSKRMKKQLFERYLLFLVGLFIASMGVAFSTKAGLGTSPVAFRILNTLPTVLKGQLK